MTWGHRERGTLADRSATRRQRERETPLGRKPGRYSFTTYSLRMAIAPEAVADRNYANMSNRWYFRNGRRGGMRRRREPYELELLGKLKRYPR